MIPRVSVIIVNWNGLQYLDECLGSLSAQTYRDFETILVDNGSQDTSLAFVKEHYPEVKVVALHENTGFAQGNNVGFAVAQGEFFVTLNNDTRVDSRWLEELVRVADDRPGVGMVASRICAYDAPDRLDSIGVALCRDGMSRAAFRNCSYSALGFAGVREILLPSACAALYRRTMIAEIGGFDEDFFAYCEDTDLGLRGRLAGWQAVAALDAIVLHKYSGTGGTFSPFKLYLVERNHFWMAMKCFPARRLLLLPLWTTARYWVQAQLVMQGRGAGAQLRSGSSSQLMMALLRALWDALKGMPRTVRKREQVKTFQQLSSYEVSRLLDKFRLTFRELLDVG